MKFFKSTLSIMILFTTSSMFAARLPKGRTLAAKPTARKTPTKPAPKTTVTTTQPTTATQPQTYKMLLSKIKTMPANEVVDNAGNTLQPALFKQEYLDNRVKKLLQTNTEQKTKNILEQELLTGLRREWADRGITNIVSSTKIALEQINDTVIKIVEENREKLEEAQDILRKLQTKGTSSAEKAEEALMKIKARSQTEKPASSYDRPLPALPEPTQAQLITTELAKIDNINAAFAADISVAQKAETLIPVLGALKKAYPNMSSADAAVPLMAALSEQGGAIAQWNDAGKAELKKEIEDWFNKIEVQK